MTKSNQDQLVRFLQQADQALSSKHQFIVIGGAAALLNYGAIRTTADIDTIGSLAPELEKAFEWAREQMGFDIPVQVVGIHDAPYNFEERLQPANIDGLRRLSVFVPEQHDLALMKTVRGYDHDIQVIWEMHRAKALDLDVLKQRFHTEMTHVMGNPENLRLSFLAVVERLYGFEAATRVEEELDKDHDSRH